MKGLYVFLVFVIVLRSLCAKQTPNSNSIFEVLTYGAKGDGQTDDSNAFLKAWNDICASTTNDTQTLIIPEGKTFLLQPLTFQGPCKSATIIFKIKGNITAPKDIESWKFKMDEKKTWIQFSKISDLVVNGDGHINGQGSPWWVKYPRNHENNRPTALRFLNCENITLNNLTHTNSPRNHISIDSCKGVSIFHLYINAPQDSPNTDGFDISSSSDVVIENSIIQTGDDCAAINSGTNFVNITGVFCGPGHGISVGSLGKNGTRATVEQVHVKNCTFTGTSNGGRIKTYKGGSGYARSITFEDIVLVGVKNPVIIDQNYSPYQVENYLSAVEVSNVTYRNIRGTSIGKFAIQLNCDLQFACTNIVLDQINITSVTKNVGEQLVSCINAHGTSSSCYPNVSCLSQNNSNILY